MTLGNGTKKKAVKMHLVCHKIIVLRKNRTITLTQVATYQAFLLFLTHQKCLMKENATELFFLFLLRCFL